MASTICELPVMRAFPALSGSNASLVLYNNRIALKYDTTNQQLIMQGILSDKYLGGNINVKLYWVMSPYFAGTVTWEVAYKNLAAGVDYTDVSYNATHTVSNSAAGNNLLNIHSIAFTAGELGYSGVPVDELFRIKIKCTAKPSSSILYIPNIVLENP